MRVLALVMEAFGGEGGIARFNRDLLRALSSIGQTEIVVLPRFWKQTSESIPSQIISRPAPFNKPGYGMEAVRTLWRRGPFDLIFCGHLHLAGLTAILSRLAKIPVWLQLHGIEAWRKPPFPLSWAVKQMTFVTAVSRYTRRRFLEWAGIDPAKVRVLPNTVDENFHPGPKPEYLLSRYGLQNKKILLTVSRLSSKERYKGHDRVLRILPHLLRIHPNLIYIIAGEGDDRARLEAVTHEQGLDGAVRFIGRVKESELVDHYRMADLFVMPSTGEGFGIVFLEAVACGVPVVGGKEAGSMDALLEGELGRLVQSENEGELIESILENLDGKKTQNQGVHRFSQENFTGLVKRFAEKMVSWS